jgi:putative nucleotidyltransferase with HDIG domain
MESVDSFWSTEKFTRLKMLISGAQTPGNSVYLVGGAVRDALLNRPIHDIDFVLSGDVRPLARKMADALGGAFYMLDDERGTARVIEHRSGEDLFLDFASLRGSSLEEDLRARDFTINAMAVDMAQIERLIDPLGGLADLRAKRLAVCSPTAFDDDPARILRAVRIALVLKFQIPPETYRAMEYAVPLLDGVSNERQRDELFRMLSGKDVASAIRLMDKLGALETILPELGDLRGVEQGAPHHLEVWEHTLAVLNELETLYHVLVEPYDEDASANLIHGTAALALGRYRQQFQAHFAESLNPNRSLRGLLFFAALYHDAGKPSTRRVEPNGRVRFFEHENVGARMAAHRAHELALSTAEISRVEDIVHNHMRIHLLVQSMETPSRRAIYRYFQAAGPAGVEICLLSLADLLATYRNDLPQELWRKEIEFCRIILEAWWEKPAEVVKPPRLLSGSDLIQAFHIEPGPQIGELLEAIQEAQACGEIVTREQALELAHSQLSKSS